MPNWTLKSIATKMLQKLSSNTAPRRRKGSIDTHAHTQHSYFVEPIHNAASCDHIGHRPRLAAPYTLLSKYEKRFLLAVQSPNFQKFAMGAMTRTGRRNQMKKAKGGLVDRNRRRYGMMHYPDGVREELRGARTSGEIITSSARHDNAVSSLLRGFRLHPMLLPLLSLGRPFVFRPSRPLRSIAFRPRSLPHHAIPGCRLLITWFIRICTTM
ncbi:hypothetical protein RSAG8_09329, partial [Rhizoctonia solani AG-8 WAC10335]